LAELEEKEKKLVEVRQRMKAERDAKTKASEAAAPINPLYVIDRRLSVAVSNLRKKGTDPSTLAELKKKEKKLLEVRQRLKAEKKSKMEALDAADPDKRAVKKQKSSREYVAERKKVLAEINIKGKNEDERIVDTGDGVAGSCEEEEKKDESENEEYFNEMIEDLSLIEWHGESETSERIEGNEEEEINNDGNVEVYEV
jgi:hypothetical protein